MKDFFESVFMVLTCTLLVLLVIQIFICVGGK